MRKVARVCRPAIALLHLYTHLTSYRTMYNIVQGQCAINRAVSRLFHNGCEHHSIEYGYCALSLWSYGDHPGVFSLDLWAREWRRFVSSLRHTVHRKEKVSSLWRITIIAQSMFDELPELVVPGEWLLYRASLVTSADSYIIYCLRH